MGTTGAEEGFSCYKAVADVTEVSTVSCVWEDAAPVLNAASLECVCQEPAMSFVSQELVSSTGSSVLPNGQVDIHVQFPQYLENVLVKFESQDAIEGWNVTEADCRKVLKKTFELSEFQYLATVSVQDAELSFTLFFSATETFLHEDDGASVTRTVSKPLTFVLSLATNVQLSTDLSLHSQLESILALEFNFPYSEFTGTDEEIQACIEADLQNQGVVVLAVQDSNVLGGFRRALSANTDNTNAVIVIAGSQVDMEAAGADLQSGVIQMECMEGAEVLNTVDYTQIVSITSDYSFVSNNDGLSIATIQYSTAINEPWEFTGEYTIENDMNVTYEYVSLEQVTDENSCKVAEEYICEQSWTLVIHMPAEDACSMSEMTFLVTMQSAHGEEVFDGSKVSFDIAVTPNQEDCEQISNLGDVSNVAGVVQVWNSNTEAYEETPTWEIFVGDMVQFQAAVTSELGTLASVTLTNIRARQESEVCEDCLTEFSEEFEFSCLNCVEDANATTVEGDSMEFNLRLSRSVFSGTTGTGKATELVFAFDLTYVQGSQRRLLVLVDTQSQRRRAAVESGDSHVSKVFFGLHDWSRNATPADPENLDHLEMVVNFLLIVVALLVVLVCFFVYTVISYRSGREKEDYRLTEEQEESPHASVEQVL